MAGRYSLLGLIASGGMGSVYRARDIELDDVVALKILRSDLVGTPEMLARFRQEVKLARRVTHANVARTFDIGEHQGDKFLTMEFIDGASLAERLQMGEDFPLERVVAIAAAIGSGLEAAHEAGVVHRDLKPDNVMVTASGRVVITDFGIARALDGSVMATMGRPIGTPTYMAPEQVEGVEVDRRADVYALGEILSELLTGDPVWTGDSIFQVAAARLLRPAPSLREKRPDLPDAVIRVVDKCLERKPDARYATAAEVVSELAGIALPAAATKRSEPAPSPNKAASHVRDKLVAVLPFRHPAAEDEYLADGLTEDLIDNLSVASGVRVRALGVVARYKGQAWDPREIGRELGVHVVVEGSVRRSAQGLRVSARILSVNDGFQLWGGRFERQASEFLKIGDEIANAVTRAITVERRAEVRATLLDPLAYDLHLRARYELHHYSKDATARAIAFYQQAMARQPDDPVILSGYAVATLRDFFMGDDFDGERARIAVERALELAPDLPETRVAAGALALAFGDTERGAREVRAALHSERHMADAHEAFGRLAMEVERVEVGIEHLRIALELEPRRTGILGDMARGYELAGYPAVADEIFAHVPEDATGLERYWMLRSRMLTWRRDSASARAALAMKGPNAPIAPGRLVLSALAGEASGEAILKFLDGSARVGGVAMRRTASFRQFKAEGLMFLGWEEAALDALEESEQAGLFDITWCRRCPLLEPIRRHPRFLAVQRSVLERAERVRIALGIP